MDTIYDEILEIVTREGHAPWVEWDSETGYTVVFEVDEDDYPGDIEFSGEGRIDGLETPEMLGSLFQFTRQYPTDPILSTFSNDYWMRERAATAGSSGKSLPRDPEKYDTGAWAVNLPGVFNRMGETDDPFEDAVDYIAATTLLTVAMAEDYDPAAFREGEEFEEQLPRPESFEFYLAAARGDWDGLDQLDFVYTEPEESEESITVEVLEEDAEPDYDDIVSQTIPDAVEEVARRIKRGEFDHLDVKAVLEAEQQGGARSTFESRLKREIPDEYWPENEEDT